MTQKTPRQPFNIQDFGLLAAMLLLVPLLGATAQTTAARRDTSLYTPVFALASKECKDNEAGMSEGDDFAKTCRGYGGYRLLLTGMDYRINYAIANPARNFEVYLFPLETGEASRYERADQYDSKPGSRIEWLLAGGKPFAVAVRMAFYKNIGSAKTFANPKNKAAEFVFVRGLAGYEDIKFDVPTANTAHNPDEQARYLAYRAFEKHAKSK